MAGLILLSLMATPLSGDQLSVPASAERRTEVSASARATVRILPGVRVNFSDEAKGQGYRLGNATITVEDGRQLPAKLVEFQ